MKTLWESCEKKSNPQINAVFHHFTRRFESKRSEMTIFINQFDTALSEMKLKKEFSTMRWHG